MRRSRSIARPVNRYLTRRVSRACECALLACSALAILALVLLPPRTPFFAWFFELWGGHRSYNLGGAWSWPPVWRLYVLLPLVLYGLPTVLMGVAFTVLQRAVHDDVAGTGRRVGVLQAANIAGCVGGSLLAGLVGLTWAGSAGVLRLLVLAGVVFAAVGIVRTEARGAFAAGAASLLALALLMPGERALWLRLHGLTGGEALVAEDASGVVALTPGRSAVGGSGSTAGPTARFPSAGSTRRSVRLPPSCTPPLATSR